MCFNPSQVRRVPSPNRYMEVARFCFCKNNKRTIDRLTSLAVVSVVACPASHAHPVESKRQRNQTPHAHGTIIGLLFRGEKGKP